MKNKKMYFDKNSDMEACYCLEHFIKERIESTGDIFLEEAQAEHHNGLYFCTEYGEVGEVGEGCGSECPKYKPRNGKNGRCKFSNNTSIGSGKVFKLTDKLKLVAAANYGK